jgi:hypothetical protein
MDQLTDQTRQEGARSGGFNSPSQGPATIPPATRAGPPGRLDLSVDDETYEAGSGSIVVITLRNPFDLPIEVLELKQPRSSNLRAPSKAIEARPDGVPAANRFLKFLLGGIPLFGSAISASIGFGGMRAQFSSGSDKKLELNVAKDSTVDIGSALSDFDTVVVNAADGSKIKVTPPPSGEDAVRVIQPHCETNALLTIGTRGWLFFKPTRLRLKSEIRYRIDGEPTEYTQVMPLNFDVRPPLRSVLIGAISGAVLGGAARFVKDMPGAGHDVFGMGLRDWITQGIQLGGSVIMAVIATIALSRKTGAQGFITVEDFFGGFVIGVLIAYEGTSYFEELLNHATPPKTAGAQLP